MKYFYLITSKKDTTEEKDPPKGKELANPSGLLSKVIPSSSIVRSNTAVTKVPKQAKWSVTPNCYMKLTPAQRYKIGKKRAEMGVTAAIHYYKKNFPNVSLIEPNVRRLKNFYLEECAKKPLDNIYSSKFNILPYKKYGRPLNVSKEVDSQVQA